MALGHWRCTLQSFNEFCLTKSNPYLFASAPVTPTTALRDRVILAPQSYQSQDFSFYCALIESLPDTMKRGISAAKASIQGILGGSDEGGGSGCQSGCYCWLRSRSHPGEPGGFASCLFKKVQGLWQQLQPPCSQYSQRRCCSEPGTTPIEIVWAWHSSRAQDRAPTLAGFTLGAIADGLFDLIKYVHFLFYICTGYKNYSKSPDQYFGSTGLGIFVSVLLCLCVCIPACIARTVHIMPYQTFRLWVWHQASCARATWSICKVWIGE